MPPCVSRACRKNIFLTAFSLIELLVVIAIVMILAGIAVSGISDSQHNSRRISRELTKAHLQQARAHAITTRHHTALVIPVRNSGKHGLRAMSWIRVERVDGLFVALEEDNSMGKSSNRWTMLPGNLHFVTSEMIGLDQPTIVDQELTITIRYQAREMECHMIVFAPSGKIVFPLPGSPIRVAIAPLIRHQNTFRIQEGDHHEPASDLLLINRLTAKTRVTSR